MNAPFRLPGTPLDPANPINRGLVGFWPMWEGAGGKTLDISGKNNHGTLTNGPLWSGGGLELDDTDDYIATPGVSIPAASDFTFALKILPRAWIGNNPGVWRAGSASTGTSFNIFQLTTGVPWIRWNAVDILKPVSGYSVPLNEISSLVFTVGSASNVAFYSNGVLRHSATHTTDTAAFTINNIGWQNLVGERVRGLYDYARVWTRALSALEAQQLYVNPNIGLWVPDTIRYYIPAAGGADVRRKIIPAYMRFAA